MKLRVLVVDDNQANRMIVRSLLEPSGIDVTLAGNGQDALKEVRSSRFDLVLMDIHMPGMDGCETAGRIRKENGCETIPVIAMTATSGTVSGDSELFGNAGMNGCILKPVSKKKLFQVISEATGHTIPRADTDMKTGRENEPVDHEESYPESLPGISIRETLVRLDMCFDVFCVILKEYYSGHHDVMERIDSAFETKDWSTLKEIAHSVKGASAGIGANDVAEAARALEFMAVLNINNQGYGISDDSIGRLDSAVKTVLKSLEEIIGTGSADECEGTGVKEADFHALIEALKTGQPVTVKEEMSIIRNSAPEFLVKEIEGKVSAYDYDDAIEIITGYLSGMNSSGN